MPGLPECKVKLDVLKYTYIGVYKDGVSLLYRSYSSCVVPGPSPDGVNNQCGAACTTNCFNPLAEVQIQDIADALLNQTDICKPVNRSNGFIEPTN
jgi:hypothetical protein